jgi:signal transduction histidine kinase
MSDVSTIVDRFVAPVHEPRPKRPSWQTWVIAALGLALSITELIVGLPGPVGGAILAVAICAGFVVRRVGPAASLALVAGASIMIYVVAGIADRPVEITASAWVLAIVSIYALARHAPARIVALTALLAVLAVPAAELANRPDDESAAWSAVSVLGNATTIGVALALRATAANRWERERAAQVNERNQLANDIHDSVAHHMSAIAIQAESALHQDSSEVVLQALGDIKKSASTGLTDMRHLVNQIRDHSIESRPLPGLGDIRQLAAETTTPQLRVTATIDADTEILPITISTAAYAIAREAITNVRRHATHATEASIVIRDTGRSLDVTISDDGTTPLTIRREGHGLRSMNQRASAVGGALTAGPNPTGGWLVVAQLPTQDPPT